MSNSTVVCLRWVCCRYPVCKAFQHKGHKVGNWRQTGRHPLKPKHRNKDNGPPTNTLLQRSQIPNYEPPVCPCSHTHAQTLVRSLAVRQTANRYVRTVVSKLCRADPKAKVGCVVRGVGKIAAVCRRPRSPAGKARCRSKNSYQYEEMEEDVVVRASQKKRSKGGAAHEHTSFIPTHAVTPM